MKPKIPSFRAFWILSTGYRDAGDAVHCQINTKTYVGFALFPCIFLYFRCIELALKSVLAYHSVPAREITRTLGHRISKLIARTETFLALDSLGISVEDRTILDQFSEMYSDKWFEYPHRFWEARPKREELKRLAHRVCDMSQSYTKKPRDGGPGSDEN